MIEFKDGYHPITNDCIWKSGLKDEEALMFVWQGRSSPEGQDSARVRFVMKETNRLKDNRQPLMISKLWVRWFKHGIIIAIYFITTIFAAYIAYLVWMATRM